MKRKIFSLMVAMILVLTAVPAVAEEEVVNWQNLGLDAMDGWTVAAGSTGTAEIQSETKAEGTGALKIVNEEGQTTTVTQAITLPSTFRGTHFSVRAQLKVASATGNGARLEVWDSSGAVVGYSTNTWQAQTEYITYSEEKFIWLDITPWKSGKAPYVVTLILDGAGEVYFDNVQIQELYGFANADFESYSGYTTTGGKMGGGWKIQGNTRIESDVEQGNYAFLPSTDDWLNGFYMLGLAPNKIYRMSWKHKVSGGYYVEVALHLHNEYSETDGISSNSWSFSSGSRGVWDNESLTFTLPEGYWGITVKFRGAGHTAGLALDDFVLEEVPETDVSFAEGENGATNITTVVASKVADETPFILLCRYGKQGTARVLKDVKVVSPTLTSSAALGSIPVAYIGSQTESFTTDTGDTIEVMRWDSTGGLVPLMDKIVR